MKKTDQRQRGASLVEFALILPIFLFFVFLVLDLGRYFYMEQRMSHILRSAIRESTVYDPFRANATLTRREVFVNRLRAVDGNLVLSGITIPSAAGSQTANDALVLTPADAGSSGEMVTAELRIPFVYLTPVGRLFNLPGAGQGRIAVKIRSTNEP